MGYYSLWETVESNAWSMDFDYENYCTLCERAVKEPLHLMAYKLICEALDIEYEESMEKVADFAVEINS